MHTLTLDYVHNARSRIPAIVILLVCTVLIGYLGKTYIHLTHETDRWQIKSSQLKREQRRTEGNDVSMDQSARLKDEFNRANAIVQQLTLPWNGLFKAVDASGYEDVALLSIQPDGDNQSVTITAESKDLAGMLEYVRRLGKEPTLTNTTLVNHQIQQQDPLRPIRFAVTTEWKR